MTAWAIRLPGNSAHVAASLRNMPGVEVCAEQDQLWCRGPVHDDAIAQQLRHLPGAWRFRTTDGEQLIPIGQFVPTERLPSGPWIRISDWLRFALPEATASRVEFQKHALPRVSIKLVRSNTPRQPTILQTSFEAWCAYGARAPAVRLAQWSFALRSDGQCLIRGVPLPPLVGMQLVEVERLLVPAGWTWSPPVEPSVIHELAEVKAGEMVLFDHGGRFESIRQTDWVRATRSAIRLSAKVVANGDN